MDYSITFPVDVFADAAAALVFVHPFVRIPFESITSTRAYQDGLEPFELEEALQRLGEKQDRIFHITSETDETAEDRNSVIFNLRRDEKVAHFMLRFEKEKDVDLDALLRAAGKKGMTFSYKYDFWKAYWSSVEVINTYEVAKRPFAHLKKKMNPKMPPFLREMIDISENPGHQRLTFSMKLMAAPEMWFGPGCWPYFDRQRVTSFPDAQAVDWLEPDLLHVRLFDAETPDYEAGNIVHLQQRFRQWTGMDEVEALLETKLEN